MTVLLLLLVAAVAFGFGVLRGENNAARRESDRPRVHRLWPTKARHAAGRHTAP